MAKAYEIDSDSELRQTFLIMATFPVEQPKKGYWIYERLTYINITCQKLSSCYCTSCFLWARAVCLQSPEKEIVTPRVFSAVTVKGPGPIVISIIHTRQAIDDGWGLLPVSCIGDGQANPLITAPQAILRIPVVSEVPVVLGTPLPILFAALWLHELDTGLLAPTVSQSAFCLVSCYRILESANTAVGTFAVNTPVTNTVANRINTIWVWLWRFVFFARVVSISGLGMQILIYVPGFSGYKFVY